MSYYRGYDDGDYGVGAYESRFESDYRDRDRYAGYGDREEREYRAAPRAPVGYDRRDSLYDRRESGYGGRREGGYGGRRETDYEGRREGGYRGRREGGWGEKSEGRPRGGRGGGRGGRGGFSRENGGRGAKRSFSGRDRGSPSKREKPEDNWEKLDRHAAMRSHFMEAVPENFEEDWLCIICPAGKRRILVAANNITQTYDSSKHPDQKFKSCLPSGSPLQNEVMKYNDLSILDTVYDSQKKQFYIIDMLHWKHYPYYETEAEFRAFFLPEKYNQLKTPTELSENNEYPLILLEKFPCSESSIEQALKETDYKVEGLMFFNKKSTYECSDSSNFLLLRLDQMEKVIGIPVREGISYTKTSSSDAEWKEELKERKKVKAARELAKEAQENAKQEEQPKEEEKDDTSSGTWGTNEVAFSAAYYD